MKLFRLEFTTIILRYYLMMFIVLAAGFTGQWWLSVLALPILMSCLMAVKFGSNPKKVHIQREMSQKDDALAQSAA